MIQLIAGSRCQFCGAKRCREGLANIMRLGRPETEFCHVPKPEAARLCCGVVDVIKESCRIAYLTGVRIMLGLLIFIANYTFFGYLHDSQWIMLGWILLDIPCGLLLCRGLSKDNWRHLVPFFFNELLNAVLEFVLSAGFLLYILGIHVREVAFLRKEVIKILVQESFDTKSYMWLWDALAGAIFVVLVFCVLWKIWNMRIIYKCGCYFRKREAYRKRQIVRYYYA
ncbi:hypothetical protein QR680_016651 [Steinernema hermaphroditum]|uniref:Uncharacterized protein n=1 Tax=Steinernema hermaphroditum TaxID=289476 RepID=A0AA39LMZ6_9BILA|nr:hypothetical protein QR680_016651 [Steinernema hermaphroditum]